MAVGCSPWDVITALDEIVDQNECWASRDKDATASKAGTGVTITEGYDIWWPNTCPRIPARSGEPEPDGADSGRPAQTQERYVPNAQANNTAARRRSDAQSD